MSYKLTIEIEAESEKEMWSMLDDATTAAENNFDGIYWNWSQQGWTVEIEADHKAYENEDLNRNITT
jgi:hypothetical protein